MCSASIPVRLIRTTVLAIALAGAGVVATEANGTAGVPQVPSANAGIGSLQIESLSGAATPILGFGFEVLAPVSSDGSGSGAGKVTVSDVTVNRTPDALSPQLFRAAVFGEHLPAVRIAVSGTARTPETSYLLTDATIASYTNNDGVERIAFRFSKIQLGAGGTPVCYDVAQNRVC